MSRTIFIPFFGEKKDGDIVKTFISLSVHPPAGMNVYLSVLKLWTPVYFNELYSLDTQAYRFVCQNYVQSILVCLIFDTQGYFVCKETQSVSPIKKSVRQSVRANKMCVIWLLSINLCDSQSPNSQQGRFIP